MLLEGGAREYMIEQIHRNNDTLLTWEEYKYVMRERYDKPERRDRKLREYLEKLRYPGPARMEEFCVEFHRVETQISDRELTFRGRLLIFMRTMPHEVRTCINLSRPTTMDDAYQTASTWAEAYAQGQQPQRIERLRIRDRDRDREQEQPAATSSPEPLLAITAPQAPPTPPAEAPGEELNMLNRMDARANSKCYSCGKYGHFASSCPTQRDAMAQGTPSHRRGGWKDAGAASTRRSSAGKPQQSLHAMELMYSDEDLGEEEEYESDYETPITFNAMEMETDIGDGDSSDDSESDADTLVEEELYELTSDGQETRTPMSSVLPTYDAEISGTTCKMLIDTGASSIYVSKRLVKRLGLKTTKVKSRRVKVADDDTKIVNRIATIDVKLGNLPVETLKYLGGDPAQVAISDTQNR